MFKCSNNIILVPMSNALSVVDKDGKGWPGTQIFPDRSSWFVAKLDTKTVWWCKHNLSPSLVDVHQYLPHFQGNVNFWKVCSMILQKSNISSNTSSGSMSIIVADP